MNNPRLRSDGSVVIREGPLPEAIERLATWLRMHSTGIHRAE
jgi:hypothetical protein